MKRHMILFMTAVVLGLGFPLTTYASAQTITYTVSQGDTLSKISRQYHVSVQALLQTNHLANDKLQIGQLLQVPTTGTATPAISATSAVPSSQSATSSNSVPVAATTQSSKQTGITSAVTSTPAANESVQPQDLQSPHAHIEANTQVRVNVPILNMREKPTTESAILAKLSLGTLLTVIETDPEWTKITYKDQDAYVATPYISPVVPLTIASNMDNSTLLTIIQPLLKTPYVLGGTTPDGFDCSGFTSYVYQQLGITLPRTSEEQFTVGQEVPREQLQPGDLLFYDALNKGKVSHVAMYMGDGLIVHANGTEVRYEKVANMDKLYPYYGAKRMIP